MEEAYELQSKHNNFVSAIPQNFLLTTIEHVTRFEHVVEANLNHIAQKL